MKSIGTALLKAGNWLHPSRIGGLRWSHYLLCAAGLAGGSVVPAHQQTTYITKTVPVRSISYTPPSGKTFRPPYDPGPPPIHTDATQAVHVHGVYTRDTHVDISAAVNAAADQYGLNPVGFVALLGTESNIMQYAPHYPIAGAGYCDYSGGLSQITACTAGGYPLFIGDGSETTANINYIFWYEQQDPNRDVWLTARLLTYFKSLVCWDFKPLYSAWNQGPGYGCYSTAYEFPSGGIAQQAWSNYGGWWDYAWANYATYQTQPAFRPTPVPTAKPKPFPLARWCHSAKSHHLRCASPLQNGKPTWPASIFVSLVSRNQRPGGFVRSAWFGLTRRRHHGYDEYFYGKLYAVAWPSFHTWRAYSYDRKG